MTRLLALLLALLTCSAPAVASLARVDLDAVVVTLPDGAKLPTELPVVTEEGRSVTLGDVLGGKPTLLLPLDPRCRVVCGPALSILGGALGATGLEAGRDYRLVVVAIGRPDEDAARTLVSAQLGEDWRRSATLVIGPPDAIRQITEALGYRFVEDGDNDAIAHPSAFFALSGEGRVSRVLSSLALNADDLRLALVEAGRGGVGGLADRLKLLCYGFDTAHGVYTSRVRVALRVGAVGIVLAIIAGVFWLSRRRRALPAAYIGGAAR